MRFNFRHGIIRQSANYLAPTASGINISIGNNTPLEVAIAHKDKNYLHVESKDILLAWGLRPEHVAGNAAWLYIDIDTTTAVRTFGYTRLDMVVSASAPVSPTEGLNWFDTTTITTKAYTNGAWVEVVRIFIAKYLDNVITPYSTAGVSQVSISTVYADYLTGMILYDSSGDAIRTQSNGTFLTSETDFHLTGNVAQSIRLESDIVYAQSLENMAAYSVVVYSQYGGGASGKITLADYEDVDTSVIAMTAYPLAIGDIGTVITSGNITNLDWDWELAGVPIGAKLYVGAGAEIGTLVSEDPSIANPLLPKKSHVARVIGKNQIQFAHNYSLSSVSITNTTSGTSTPATDTTLGVVELYQNDATDPLHPKVVTIETLASELGNLTFSSTAAEIATATIPTGNGTPGYAASNVQAVLKLLHDNKADKIPSYLWTTIHSNYTVVDEIIYLIVDTTDGPVEVTLPAAPTTNSKIVLVPLYPTYPTNNLILRRNTKKIMHVASDLYVNINQAIELNYIDADLGWLVIDQGDVGLVNRIDDSGIGAHFQLTDTGIGHTHSGALTVAQIKSLLEGNAVSAITTSSVNAAHTHDVTIEFNGYNLTVTTISSNHIGEEHVVEFLDVPLSHWNVVSANYTALYSDHILANSIGGSFNITLPVNPAINTHVSIAPLYPTYATFPVTVLHNGQKIAGSFDDILLDQNGLAVELVFVGGSEGWAIIYRGDTTIINTFNIPVFWEIITATTTVAANSSILADSTLGSFNIVLPASPANNDVVRIAPLYPTYSTYPVTVTGNGNAISGSVLNNILLDADGQSIELVFIGGSVGWAIINRGDTLIANTFNVPIWWDVVSANVTATYNQSILADSTGGSFDVTLPLNPIENTVVRIAPLFPSYSTFPVTVKGNGEAIAEDLINDLLLNVNGQSIELVFIGGATGWAIINHGQTTIVNKSGTILPANAAGALINDGAGLLSWGVGKTSGSVVVAFDYTTTPFNVGTALPDNAIVTGCKINITTTFNSTSSPAVAATLTVGSALDTDGVSLAGYSNLAAVGLYANDSFFDVGTTNNQIIGTLTMSGATQGAGTLIITYSIV